MMITSVPRLEVALNITDDQTEHSKVGGGDNRLSIETEWFNYKSDERNISEIVKFHLREDWLKQITEAYLEPTQTSMMEPFLLQ